MLKNILINLISNAIKFSGEGKIIRIETNNAHNKLTIFVKDRGMGIPEEDIPLLFTTFFRGKNASNIQGTGLGLRILKRYVDLLKGEVSVKSRLEEGSVFKLTLPTLEMD